MNYIIIQDTKQKQLREKFIQNFIDTTTNYYCKYLTAKNYYDGFYYLGHLWETIPNSNTRAIYPDEAYKLLSDKDKVFVMWDMRTMTNMGKAYHYKVPRDMMIEMNGNELSEVIKTDKTLPVEQRSFLPEDIYIFDKSLYWYIIFTHEFTENGDLCITNLS